VRAAAFVITFDRPRQLLATVEALSRQTAPPAELVVVDNGASAECRQAVASCPGVRYHAMAENAGPAGAAAWALAELTPRHPWIYWVDDDDPPLTTDTLERLLQLAEQHTDRPLGGVGAVGSRWDWQRGESQRIGDEALAGPLRVDLIGGSSQLVVASAAVGAVGPPDARLFFGFEEAEFALRLQRGGYELYVDGDLMRLHREAHRRLGHVRRRRWVPADPASALWRRYYVTRNYIFSMRSTFGRPDLARRAAVKATLRSLGAWGRGLAYGLAYSRLQWRAVADGYRGRMGRTVSPVAKGAPGEGAQRRLRAAKV
jgi:GT2 family glycosyltransferase